MKLSPKRTETARFNGACASRGQRSVVSPVPSPPVNPSEAFRCPVTSDLSAPTACSQSFSHSLQGSIYICSHVFLALFESLYWSFLSALPEWLRFVCQAAGKLQTSLQEAWKIRASGVGISHLVIMPNSF